MAKAFHEQAAPSEATPKAKAAFQKAVALGYTGAELHSALAAHSRKAYVTPTDPASFYIYAGEKDRALEWLEKGFEVRDPNMPYIGPSINDSMRSDPRFQNLLRLMNLPH